MTWAQGLRRVFRIDVETCSACGGPARGREGRPGWVSAGRGSESTGRGCRQPLPDGAERGRAGAAEAVYAAYAQRIHDPLKQWKLSPMDIPSYRRWWDYSVAYDEMIRMTDTPKSPWWIVDSDDKKRARINSISHLLSLIPWERVPFDKPALGKRDKKPRDYAPDPQARNMVPDVA